MNKLHGSKPKIHNREKKDVSMNERIFIYQVHRFLVFENKMYYQVHFLKDKASLE
jgi:hypothetical protein